MKLELTQQLQQQQILAPQMVLSMDILLLTTQDLQQRIDREFAENPALEIIDPQVKESPTDVEQPRENAEPAPFGRVESFRWDTEAASDYRYRRSTGRDDKFEAMQNTEGRKPGLRDFLTQQLHLLSLTKNVQEAGEEIINNVDSRGYLTSPASELYQSLAHRVSADDFEKALSAVRDLDPPGIGAEDLQQCLLLQLERDSQDYPLETQIILNHLGDLRDNKIPKIARDLKTTIEDIREALDIIRCLDPHPGSQYDSDPPIYIRPDVHVEVNEGRIEVRVDGSSLPELSISESCRKLLTKSRSSEVNRFVRKKIESAQWLIQAIKQRQRTLHDIATAVTSYQREFILDGPEHLRALKMQTIADIVGVHISTVSRAIKGKHIQTPWGLFEMRYFFTGGVGNAQGEVESRRNIYRRIGEIIENEDKKRPLSDSAIADVLRKDGLNIARRTVTKYREQEGVPSSRRRKNHWVKSG
jgi:RNA polymerase sigma-54 factor